MVILPEVTPAGAMMASWVADNTVNLAFIAPILTLVVPVKPVPFITMRVPTGPLEGENPLVRTLGTTVMVKLFTSLPAPSLSSKRTLTIACPLAPGAGVKVSVSTLR